MAKPRKSKATASRSAKSAAAVPTSISTPSSSMAPSTVPSRAPTPPPNEDIEEEEVSEDIKPFRFFDLPSELRLRIYEEAFRVTERHVMELYEGKKRAGNIVGLDQRPDPPLDLEPNVNWFLVRPRLNLLKVSHRMHDEAYRVFYSQPMRLFPHHDRFFYSKKPLLARIPPKYRNMVNTMEVRLGKGWSKVPRCQNTDPSLGLRDCISLRLLKVFVQCDPSDSFFSGFRGKNANEDTYKWFCVDLLRGILEQVPRLETVEIDAFPGIKQGAPLITALRRVVEDAGKKLVWGPLRGWEKEGEQMMGLQQAMAGMGLSNAPRVINVQA